MTANDMLERLKPYLRKLDSTYDENYVVDSNFSIRLCYHASPPGYVSTIIKRKSILGAYPGTIAFIINGFELRVIEDKEFIIPIQVSKFESLTF
jgi:hypothetical protein